MNQYRLAAVGLAVAALVVVTGGVAAAQPPTPTPTPIPTPVLPVPTPTLPVPVPGASPEDTIAEICAATGIEEVDEALQGVATTELVRSLAPLVTLVVPEGADSVVLKTDVELDDVRTALDCDPGAPGTTTPPPAEDEDPPYESCAEARADDVDTPILAASPNYSIGLDSDGDGMACEVDEDDDTGVDRAPVGGVETGAGPA